MGKSLLVKYVYKSFEVIMVDRVAIIDLIVLDMLEFYVILSMDQLTTYHATLANHMKMVKFDPQGEPSCIM